MSGVSAVAWWIRVADGLVWTLYGAVACHLQVLVAGVLAGALAAAVPFGLRSRGRTVGIPEDVRETVPDVVPAAASELVGDRCPESA